MVIKLTRVINVALAIFHTLIIIELHLIFKEESQRGKPLAHNQNVFSKVIPDYVLQKTSPNIAKPVYNKNIRFGSLSVKKKEY